MSLKCTATGSYTPNIFFFFYSVQMFLKANLEKPYLESIRHKNKTILHIYKREREREGND